MYWSLNTASLRYQVKLPEAIALARANGRHRLTHRRGLEWNAIG